MQHVLVTGGTGDLGKSMTDHLLRENFEVSVLTSRESSLPGKDIVLFKGNLATGSGLPTAAAGKDVIIHCASDSKNFEQVDILGTQNLLNSLRRENIRHFVYISIVGVDIADYPYYRAKHIVEKMISASGIPYSIIRTTQFHSFILKMLESFLNRDDRVLRIPGQMRFQSIDTNEVAERLVAQIDEPAGLLPNVGGPEVLGFEQMAKSYLDMSGTNAVSEVADISGDRFELFRSGINLCPEHAYGKTTWKSFLENNFKTA